MKRLISWMMFLLAIVALVPGTALAKGKAYRHYQVGNPDAATPAPVSGGLLLLGGGERDARAMQWFFGKAGHGHIVILRASYGPEVGQEFYHEIGGVASVETFVFNDRAASGEASILASLKRADGIFIAGGDQAKYVRFWKGTPVAQALDAHVAAGKPIAGTSAGLAILGEYLYGAMDGGSLSSPQALAAPYASANTIEQDFLHIALLKGVITDTHFKERDRLGRLFAFVAKAQQRMDADQPALTGLGVDEDTALAIEPDGDGQIYGPNPESSAWLVEGIRLRNLQAKGPLKASGIKVTRIVSTSKFHLPTRTAHDPAFAKFYDVNNGRLSEVAH